MDKVLYNKYPKFTLINDEMFEITGEVPRKVPRLADRVPLIQDLHVSCGHVGILKLYNMLRGYYYWPGLYDDVSMVVKGCVSCQKLKSKLKVKPLKPTNKFSTPFKCWSIDLLPTLPTTKEGFRHILLMVDVFSKWVEILPLKTKASSEVWDVMFEEVFCRFGLPI